MQKEHKKFLIGAAKNGYSEEMAEKIWGFIERFVGYGFNIPHAVSYAMIAYQTAYMKVKYPVEYMAAMLTSESRSASGPNRDLKIAQGIEECRRLGIAVLPPDINRSEQSFTLEGVNTSTGHTAIRFGLSAIKNVGSNAVDSILSARVSGGTYSSFSDFIQRVDAQKVNRKVLESLIKVGAMKDFGARSSLLAAIDEVRSRVMSDQKRNNDGQTRLFDDEVSVFTVALPDLPEFSKDELLVFEKELLGIYLTEHPLQKYLSEVSSVITDKIGDLTAEDSVGSEIVTAGIVTQIRIVQTKRSSQLMCFATVEDETSSIDMVVFPSTYEKYQTILTKDHPFLLRGKVDFREEKLNLIVNEILLLDGDVDKAALLSFKVSKVGGFQTISIPRGTSADVMRQLAVVLKSHSGKDRVRVIIPASPAGGSNGNGSVKTMDLPYTVAWKTVEQTVWNLLQS